MICEFHHCVYNAENRCAFESVKINGWGMCDECLIVEVPEATLNELKLQMLAELALDTD
jgi:hypothetical protein